MLTRSPLLVATLATLTTACADVPTPTEPTERPPVAAPATAVEPGPKHRPPAEPAGCVEAVGALQLGTAGMDSLRDVVITGDGEITVAGDENGTRSPFGAIGAVPMVATVRADLTGLARRSPADAPIAGHFLTLATAPDGRVWFVARTPEDALLGDVLADGTLRVASAIADPDSFEFVHQFDIGPDGQVALGGSSQRVIDGVTRMRPLLWTGTLAEAATGTLARTEQLAAPHALFTTVDIGTDRLITGSHADSSSPALTIGRRRLDGQIVWEQTVSTSSTDQLVAVALLPDGDVVWLANTREALGGVHHGGSDFALGRLDGATGAPAWTIQYGASGHDRAADLAIGPDGRAYVAASLPSVAGDSDVGVVGFDLEEGLAVMVETWGSASWDHPTALAVDPCGSLVIAGTTEGDIAGPSAGNTDGFVLVTRSAS